MNFGYSCTFDYRMVPPSESHREAIVLTSPILVWEINCSVSKGVSSCINAILEIIKTLINPLIGGIQMVIYVGEEAQNPHVAG